MYSFLRGSFRCWEPASESPKEKKHYAQLIVNHLEQNWMHTQKILQHQTASIFFCVLFINKNGSLVGFYFLFIYFSVWKYILKIRKFSTKENVFYSQVESKRLKILDKFFLLWQFILYKSVILNVVAHTLEWHHHNIIRSV